MMIQRVRLQRKFTLRNKLDPGKRLTQISQMMVVFELAFVVITAILSLSTHFHLQQLFTTEFWTAENIISSNLSLAICIFFLLPYLIFWLQISCSAIKDFVATALTIHFTFSFLINLKVTIAYMMFIIIIGIVGGALGSYGAVLRQQKKLIEQIQKIQGADRRQLSMPVQECQRMHLHTPDN